MSDETVPTRSLHHWSGRGAAVTVSGEPPAHPPRLRYSDSLAKVSARSNNVLATTALMDVGIDPHSTLTMATGLGKTAVAGQVILQLLDADRKRSGVWQQIKTQRNYGISVDELTERLLARLEADSGLPGITTTLNRRQPRLRPVDEGQCIDPLLWKQEVALSKRIVRLRDLLDLILGVVHYEFTSTIPRVDTSPCGVIRLAAPRVPRAPTLASDPLALPHTRVSAA